MEVKYMDKLSIVFFVLLIASCGGGGGSSDSPKTPPTVTTPVEPPSANNMLFSKYNGLKEKATIVNSDGHDIAYQISIIADLAHLLSYNNDFRFIRFDSAINDYSTVPIDECESGQFILGELSDNKIDVEYIQCVTGPYTLSGKGQLDGLSIDNNGEFISAALRFDELRIQNTRSSFLFEGSIKAVSAATTDYGILGKVFLSPYG